MFCVSCGNTIEDGVKFCGVCGAKITAEAGSGNGKQNQDRTFDFSNVNDTGKTDILPVGGHGMPEIPEPVKESGYTPIYNAQGNDGNGIPIYNVPSTNGQNGSYGNIPVNADPPKKKGGSKVFVIVSIIVAVLLAALAIGLTIYFTSPSVRAGKEVNLGQKYLDELDYEEAIASFKNAIKIDPNCEEAYIGMAEAYMAQDDYESAIKTLEKGYRATKSDAIQDKLEEVRDEYDQILEEQRELEEAQARLEEEARKAKLEEEERLRREEEERLRKEEEERLRKEEEERQRAINDYFNNLTEGYEVGQLMPDFAMTDQNGRRVYLSDYRGQVVFLNFFTTWCPYCYRELPGMAALDCKVLMVDLAETPQEAATYMREYGYDFEVNHLPEWKCGSFEIEGVPTSFVIDEYGIIRGYQMGQADDAWMKSTVEYAKTAIYEELPELNQ